MALSVRLALLHDRDGVQGELDERQLYARALRDHATDRLDPTARFRGILASGQNHTTLDLVQCGTLRASRCCRRKRRPGA